MRRIEDEKLRKVRCPVLLLLLGARVHSHLECMSCSLTVPHVHLWAGGLVVVSCSRLGCHWYRILWIRYHVIVLLCNHTCVRTYKHACRVLTRNLDAAVVASVLYSETQEARQHWNERLT